MHVERGPAPPALEKQPIQYAHLHASHMKDAWDLQASMCTHLRREHVCYKQCIVVHLNGCCIVIAAFTKA